MSSNNIELLDLNFPSFYKLMTMVGGWPTMLMPFITSPFIHNTYYETRAMGLCG
jgi:hypothetical protein